MIKRRMPFLLDLLTLLMEAGSTFLNALTQAVEEFRGHPVAEEFGRVLADMNLGKTRTEAFQAMRDRLADDEITSIIGSILQGETPGHAPGPDLPHPGRRAADQADPAGGDGGRRGGRQHAPARRAGHGGHGADHHRAVPVELPANSDLTARCSMAIKLDCPRCKQPLSVPNKKAGSYVNCPRCKGRFWVPKDADGRFVACGGAAAVPRAAAAGAAASGRRAASAGGRSLPRRRRAARRPPATAPPSAAPPPAAAAGVPSAAAAAPPAAGCPAPPAPRRRSPPAARWPASSPPRPPSRRSSRPPTASCPTCNCRRARQKEQGGSARPVRQSAGALRRALR